MAEVVGARAGEGTYGIYQVCGTLDGRELPRGLSVMLEPPVWSTPREAVRVVVFRPHLRRTCITALIVGTVLFAINQLDVVLAGRATAGTWIKVAVTYLVPFTVANVGLLFGRRSP